MNFDHHPEDLWGILKGSFPDKTCPFCGDGDWIPIGISPLPLVGRQKPKANDVLIIGCRACGYEWLHSVEMIVRLGRRTRRLQ
jgi:hypothetical protein